MQVIELVETGRICGRGADHRSVLAQHHRPSSLAVQTAVGRAHPGVVPVEVHIAVDDRRLQLRDRDLTEPVVGEGDARRQDHAVDLIVIPDADGLAADGRPRISPSDGRATVREPCGLDLSDPIAGSIAGGHIEPEGPVRTGDLDHRDARAGFVDAGQPDGDIRDGDLAGIADAVVVGVDIDIASDKRPGPQLAEIVVGQLAARGQDDAGDHIKAADRDGLTPRDRAGIATPNRGLAVGKGRGLGLGDRVASGVAGQQTNEHIAPVRAGRRRAINRNAVDVDPGEPDGHARDGLFSGFADAIVVGVAIDEARD